MIQASRGVLQGFMKVFRFKVRHFGKDLLSGQARRKEIKHIDDANAHSTDARTAAALLKVDRDPV
jgi:hypothetical protein